MKNTRSDFDDMSIHRFFISLKYVAAITIVCWLSGGCLDETGRLNEAVSFSATVAQDMTKTVLGDRLSDGSHDVHWQAAETMIIGGAAYQLRNRIDDQTAIFEPAVAHQYASRTDDGKYKAYYPASIYNNGTLTLPDTQTYTPSEEGHPVITNLPMYAESENNQLQFRNLCAAIHFSVTGIAKITHVVVKSKSHALWGPFRIENHKAVMTGTDESYRTLTYRLSQGSPAEGVQLDPLAPTEVYIALPALEEYPAGDLTFTIYADDKVVRTLANPDQAVSLIRSSIYDFAAQTALIVIDPVTVDDMVIIDGGGLAETPYNFYVSYGNQPTIDENGGTYDNWLMIRSSINNGSSASAVPYKIQYSELEGETWREWQDGTPSWIELSGSTASSSSSLSLTVHPQENSWPYYGEHTRKLKANPPKNGFDLSTYNVATGTSCGQTTANCYVVQASGTYKFPLVYGNGLKNGQPNPQAYHWNATGTPSGRGFLVNYRDHLDNEITQPYITAQYPEKVLTAQILWMDAEGLVQDAAVVDGYMTFSVPNDNICQGNAVIAVLADGVIAWSWHIWVTDDESLSVAGNPQFAGEEGCTIAPVNIGWCDAETFQYQRRECRLRVIQPSSGNISSIMTIVQPEKTITRSGNNPDYQWGRKDPFPPTIFNTVSTTRQSPRTIVKTINKTIYTAHYAFISEQNANITSVGILIRNPHVYYYNNNGSNKSYLFKAGYDIYNLWNSSLEPGFINAGSNYSAFFFRTPYSKTIYDPSPVGFMVPPFWFVTADNPDWVFCGSEAAQGWDSERPSGHIALGNWYIKGGARVFFPSFYSDGYNRTTYPSNSPIGFLTSGADYNPLFHDSPTLYRIQIRFYSYLSMTSLCPVRPVVEQ